MERDEERSDAEAEDEGGLEEPAEGPTPEARRPAAEPDAEPPDGERQRYLLTAGISAAVVVLGAALFALGFLTHSLLDDDVDLKPIEKELAALNEQADAIQVSLTGAGGDGTEPTPTPLVEATADDDPFIGPEDAPVTIIEFSDYQ